MRESDLREIFDKTNGHCHFCGDPIEFGNRGWSEKPDGHWEKDHVIQRDKGGAHTSENCLPACTRCNRLRWARPARSALVWRNRRERNQEPHSNWEGVRAAESGAVR